jgi:type II secretory pathway pseudopilin PulG
MQNAEVHVAEPNCRASLCLVQQRRALPRLVAPGRQRGMLLLGVLVFLAVGSLGLALVSQRWSDSRRRDDEEELLRVGLQYRKAIESYYLRSPGQVKQLPGQVEDLLKDPRFPNTVRHLREAYADPLSHGQDWGLIRKGSALVGVYSQAEGEPFRQDKLLTWLGYEVRAKSYEEWRFVYAAAVGASAASATGSSNATPVGNPINGQPGSGSLVPVRPVRPGLR